MKYFVLLLSLLITTNAFAGGDEKAGALKEQAISDLQGQYDTYKEVALKIWDYAETGFKEDKSSNLLQSKLKDAGFKVEAGVAGMPTAFVATYGSGKPVIGILAEFDALPGLSQTATFQKEAIPEKAAGHACGHHLFGTGSVAAAIEVKQLMEKGSLKGTIKVFGTPAEEGGSGKVYMVRAGLFNDVDVVLHWHAGSANKVRMTTALANITAKFRFHGIASHAAAAPQRGRSALDGVESMDYMVNMMREHIPMDARIHYIITHGGDAPNIVPAFAEVFYCVRDPNRDQTKKLFERVIKAASGAAMGTETQMDYEIISGAYDLLLNYTLAATMQKNLEKVGGVQYTPEEIEFAKKIQKTFDTEVPKISSAEEIAPLSKDPVPAFASTDVGDVSWNVPTVGLYTATWVPGTAAHSWQAVACGGTDIAIKGMMVAVKSLAMTAIDLYTDPSLVEKAKEEFTKSRPADFVYKPMLGDRAPSLDYRE